MVNHAMLGLAFYEPDWRWVQGHCLRLSSDPDPQIRRIAVLRLEYLAVVLAGLIYIKFFRCCGDSPWMRTPE